MTDLRMWRQSDGQTLGGARFEEINLRFESPCSSGLCPAPSCRPEFITFAVTHGMYCAYSA